MTSPMMVRSLHRGRHRERLSRACGLPGELAEELDRPRPLRVAGDHERRRAGPSRWSPCRSGRSRRGCRRRGGTTTVIATPSVSARLRAAGAAVMRADERLASWCGSAGRAGPRSGAARPRRASRAAASGCRTCRPRRRRAGRVRRAGPCRDRPVRSCSTRYVSPAYAARERVAVPRCPARPAGHRRIGSMTTPSGLGEVEVVLVQGVLRAVAAARSCSRRTRCSRAAGPAPPKYGVRPASTPRGVAEEDADRRHAEGVADAHVLGGRLQEDLSTGSSSGSRRRRASPTPGRSTAPAPPASR